MRNKIVVLLALVALTGFAAAGALTVKQRNEAASLYAERFSVGELFVFEASAISPVLADASAAGVVGSPVEMTSGPPGANTALVRDHWQYSVRIQEASIVGVTSGQFLIELQVDGATLPSPIVIGQATSEANAREGVVAAFDLGATILSSSLYYVAVKPYTPPTEIVSYTVRSGFESATNRWIGVGGPINDVFNPAISFAMGKTLSITARNTDGEDPAPHNIGIKASGSTTPISPPGWSSTIDADGEEVTISWTPASAGDYTYNCQYHSSMEGTITVI